MILSLKLPSTRPDSVRSARRGAPVGRIAAGLVAAFALAAYPAFAQDPAPSDDSATASSSTDLFSSSLPEETKGLPDVPLTSQIVF